jgi:hypothetical protein
VGHHCTGLLPRVKRVGAECLPYPVVCLWQGFPGPVSGPCGIRSASPWPAPIYLRCPELQQRITVTQVQAVIGGIRCKFTATMAMSPCRIISLQGICQSWSIESHACQPSHAPTNSVCPAPEQVSCASTIHLMRSYEAPMPILSPWDTRWHTTRGKQRWDVFCLALGRSSGCPATPWERGNRCGRG